MSLLVLLAPSAAATSTSVATNAGYGNVAYGNAGYGAGQTFSPPPEPGAATSVTTYAGYGGIAYGNAAYGGGAIFTTAATPTQRYVPGHKHEHSAPHYPRYRSEEEIRRDRLALWDEIADAEPDKVEAVVAKVAKRVIARAQTEARQQDIQHPDALAYLQAHHVEQRKILEADLRRKKIEFGLHYMILLRLEIERAMSAEHEEMQILQLMMEM